jgi:hypothetical protein
MAISPANTAHCPTSHGVKRGGERAWLEALAEVGREIATDPVEYEKQMNGQHGWCVQTAAPDYRAEEKGSECFPKSGPENGFLL